MTLQEKWRPIPEFADYQASDRGRIASVKRGKFRVLAGGKTTGGYLHHILMQDGERLPRTAHFLVATAFHGPRPDGKQVRHLDGDKLNNAPSNLAWGSAEENAADKKRHGTHPQSNRTHCPQGHPYSGDNLYVHRGTRHCKTCMEARDRARAAARRNQQAVAA